MGSYQRKPQRGRGPTRLAGDGVPLRFMPRLKPTVAWHLELFGEIMDRVQTIIAAQRDRFLAEFREFLAFRSMKGDAAGLASAAEWTVARLRQIGAQRLAQLGLERRVLIVDGVHGMAQVVGLTPLMRDRRPDELQGLPHTPLLVTHRRQDGQPQVHHGLEQGGQGLVIHPRQPAGHQRAFRLHFAHHPKLFGGAFGLQPIEINDQAPAGLDDGHQLLPLEPFGTPDEHLIPRIQMIHLPFTELDALGRQPRVDLLPILRYFGMSASRSVAPRSTSSLVHSIG